MSSILLLRAIDRSALSTDRAALTMDPSVAHLSIDGAALTMDVLLDAQSMDKKIIILQCFKHLQTPIEYLAKDTI